MLLAISEVEIYLHLFKQRNPTEEWPETRLSEIKDEIVFDPKNPSLPPYPELFRKYPDSVSRSFNGGVMYNLWSATRKLGDEVECIQYACDTLSFLLIFVCGDFEHKTVPQLKQYDQDLFNPERVQLVFRIRNQPDLASFEQELWLNLADIIERWLLA